MASQENSVTTAVHSLKELMNNLPIAANHDGDAIWKLLTDVQCSDMHHRLTIRNLAESILILEIDGLIRQPLLRIKPRGVVPRRRIVAMHSDKDDPPVRRRNVKGGKFSSYPSRRIYPLECGSWPS